MLESADAVESAVGADAGCAAIGAESIAIPSTAASAIPHAVRAFSSRRKIQDTIGDSKSDKDKKRTLKHDQQLTTTEDHGTERQVAYSPQKAAFQGATFRLYLWFCGRLMQGFSARPCFS